MRPRQITLIQAADLDAWQRVLVALSRHGDGAQASARLLLVPSRHAGEQFRRTLETRALLRDEGIPQAFAEALDIAAVAPGTTTAVVAPRTCTRDDWYEALRVRSGLERAVASPMACEVLMAASARARIEAGDRAPFLIRPGLVAEMVRLHDALQRLGHDRESAGALLVPELEADAHADRGAARLLAQTRFLWQAFAEYDGRLAAAQLVDERGVRAACHARPDLFRGLHVIVATPDHHAAEGGLWPADLDLLTALPLARLDVVYTAREGAAGLARRWRARLPEARHVVVAPQQAATARLEVPEGAGTWFACRDREEEVLRFARRVKAAGPATLPATALVYRRPLPYLYLAQQVLGAAGIPYDAREALPLAAEPWAAALDVVMDSVVADHTRATLVAVLRHPLFSFNDGAGVPLDPRATLAFDRLLSRDRYLGGLPALERLVRQWRTGQTAGQRRDLPGAVAAGEAACAWVSSLAALHERAPAVAHLDGLRTVLEGLADPPVAGSDQDGRARRGRAALALVLDELREAYEAHDARPVRAREVFAVARRWIEARTFAPQRDGAGVQVLDLDAARFGGFDRVRVVGLIDGEWPETSARNVFYPGFLLARLGWPDERARAAATRAAFADLLDLPRVAVGVSAPELEQDAVVRPSALLDELVAFGLARRTPVPADEATMPVTADGALLETPVPIGSLTHRPITVDWLAWRLSTGAGPTAGETAPLPSRRHSVTAVERYQQCPFQYFAASVLRLDEEPEDEAGLPSRDAGLFVHDVLQACYAAWQAGGRVAIRPDDLPEARRVFAEEAERALERLPVADRALERLRLFGSAVGTGLLEKVLRVEVAAFGDVAARRLEVVIDGAVTIDRDGDTPQRIELAGRVDRVDWTIDGGIRVIDYKSGRRPQQAGLQPSVYALALLEQTADRSSASHVAPSGYVALREVSPWAPSARDTAAALDDGRVFGDLVRAIERGQFPVRPVNVFRCRFCDFGSVCRKDYVGDE